MVGHRLGPLPGTTAADHQAERWVCSDSSFDRFSKPFLSRSLAVSGEFGQFGPKWLDFPKIEAWETS
jgi:hypothetical protein